MSVDYGSYGFMILWLPGLLDLYDVLGPSGLRPSCSRAEESGWLGAGTL